MPERFNDLVETLRKIVAEEFPDKTFDVVISESECSLSYRKKTSLLRWIGSRLDLYFLSPDADRNRGCDLRYELSNGEARLANSPDDRPVTYGFIVRDCIGFLLEPDDKEYDG